jgi:nucleotide-binding universal stress UspA family protein
MFKHILIGTDGSELAQKAVTTGLTLARKLNAQVTAVTVTPPWDAVAAVTERVCPIPWPTTMRLSPLLPVVSYGT